MMTRKAVMASLLTLMFVAGCSGKAFEYHSQNDIPRGPGMFSGEDGAFTLYSDAQGKPNAEKSASENEMRDFKEFQEFRRWKESSGKDSPEYRESLDWQEWKAYRNWKQRQPK